MLVDNPSSSFHHLRFPTTKPRSPTWMIPAAMTRHVGGASSPLAPGRAFLGRSRLTCLTTTLMMLSFACSPHTISAVDSSKFRKCSDTGFCKQYRRTAEGPILPKFRIDPSSIKQDEAQGFLGAKLIGSGTGAPASPLDLSIKFYRDGVSRVKITEEKPLRERWQPDDVVLGNNLISTPITVAKDKTSVRINYAGDKTLVLQLDPFQVDLLVGGKAVVGVNKAGLMHFEAYRKKKGKANEAAHSDEEVKELESEAASLEADRHKGKKVVGYWEDGLAIYEDGTREEKPSEEEEEAKRRALLAGHEGEGDNWEEYFGGHTDSRPFGPGSVGVDTVFHGSKHVYGIPEHATSFALKTTAGEGAAYSDPYRLYNLDVFEYDLDVPAALYGSIPLLVSHTKDATAGLFYFNPTETFVDIANLGSSYQAHWMSECSALDLFLLPGPTPHDVFRQYTTLTGVQALPPIFALGYHQCRWNYKDEKDVAQVHAKFEELDFPYDVLWLDIEHTDGKRYFTWDKNVFPTPVKMQNELAAHGRRMVTIVDPHIKRDNNYKIHSEATAKGLYIKDKNGEDFDGFCWPGSSSYLDFTAPHVRDWWASKFGLDQYEGSTMNLYTWNDMNEPSVFNGPEVSMQKDCKNLAGQEHREWHNLYGYYMHRATAEGLTLRDPKKLERPFVLSRAFFAGSQRFGAIWTGDNMAEWSHLQMASPMLLTINLAGLSFAGADVGGFFKDTSSELMVRWMQAGAFQPFFRGHAHHDTKRKEPWVYGEPTTTYIRDAVMARYTLLPFWYTVFWLAYSQGLPVMRALWAEYPKEEATFAMDDQWLIGSDLLVKPVTTEGAQDVSVYFPGSEQWYDFWQFKPYRGPGTQTVKAPLDVIPVFQRGGSIIPRKFRLRRSSKMMSTDPLTLIVALDSKGSAKGLLYMDDEHTLLHENDKAYSVREYSFEKGVLTSKAVGEGKGGGYKNKVERLVVLGRSGKPSSVIATVGGKTRSLEFEYSDKEKIILVRKPEVLADEDWSISMK